MEFIGEFDYDEFSSFADTKKGKILWVLLNEKDKIVIDLAGSSPTNLYLLCSKIIEEVKMEDDNKNEMISSLFSAFIMNFDDLKTLYFYTREYMEIGDEIDTKRFLLFLSYVDPNHKIGYINQIVVVDAMLSKFEILKILEHEKKEEGIIPQKIKDLN
jgi:hypothetical protein